MSTSYLANFSAMQESGLKTWQSAGGVKGVADITAAFGMAEIGQRALIFPKLEYQTDKFLLTTWHDMAIPYALETDFVFQSNNDGAGLVVGYVDLNTYIRVQANAFHDQLMVWQKNQGEDTVRTFENVEVDQGVAYHLCLVTGLLSDHSMELYWGQRGERLHFIGRVDLTVDLYAGSVGLATSGPTLPETAFLDMAVTNLPKP